MPQGFKPDLILIDYIDCVQPSKNFDDANVGEGNVMRQFETLLSEFDIAGWTAVQGNRSSIKSEVVEADQMGGSIKKGQIGHFVVSIAKTLDQKENGTATMAILKSRFGKDGIVIPNIIFNNSTVQINMTEDSGVKTQVQYEKDKVKDEQNYIKSLLGARRKNVSENNNEEKKSKYYITNNGTILDQSKVKNIKNIKPRTNKGRRKLILESLERRGLV
jgi:hypothetical protein